MLKTKLGVNIDHIATIRNARGNVLYPDPLRAINIVNKAGGDSITFHLREDRRHIKDKDVFAFKKNSNLPLNFEMAATDEMFSIAKEIIPYSVCIVPEKREELTTEGGLNLNKINEEYVIGNINDLQKLGIKISIFIDPDIAQIDLAKKIGADIVEIHTGKYAENMYNISVAKEELSRIKDAVAYANKLGLICNAGHGLDFDSTKEIAQINGINEINIGHFIISESIFIGLEQVVRKMKKIINDA